LAICSAGVPTRVRGLRGHADAGGDTRAWSLYICDEMNDERRETVEFESLSRRPLGGEGGPQPAFSSAGAGRVRGSKRRNLQNPIARHAPWHARRDRLTKRASFARRRPRRNAPQGGERCVANEGGGMSTSGLDPLTRLASADENASSSHPLPQGGEGRSFR